MWAGNLYEICMRAYWMVKSTERPTDWSMEAEGVLANLPVRLGLGSKGQQGGRRQSRQQHQ